MLSLFHLTSWAEFGLMLAQIVWIDILLSGDNAIVIALACRALPPEKQNVGIALGVVPAIVLRIIFTACIAWLMTVPYLRLAGALMLAWVAANMLVSEQEEDSDPNYRTTLLGAALAVVAADLSMSLDNVVAIAAAAHGHIEMVVVGLMLSMPLIICGSKLVMWLMEKVPALVWVGAGFLGYLAGELFLSDPSIPQLSVEWEWILPLVGTFIVIGGSRIIADIKK